MTQSYLSKFCGRTNLYYTSCSCFLQVYEKLISGMYLGELTRLVLLDAIDQGILFSGINHRGRLNEKGSFPTWFVSQVTLNLFFVSFIVACH